MKLDSCVGKTVGKRRRGEEEKRPKKTMNIPNFSHDILCTLHPNIDIPCLKGAPLLHVSRWSPFSRKSAGGVDTLLICMPAGAGSHRMWNVTATHTRFLSLLWLFKKNVNNTAKNKERERQERERG